MKTYAPTPKASVAPLQRRYGAGAKAECDECRKKRLLESHPLGKSERAFDSQDDDDRAKVEASGGAASGSSSVSLGVAGVALAGGAGGGAAAAAAPVGITWAAANYASDGSGGSSTTVEKAFGVTYGADKDASGTKWFMRVKSVSGGVDIKVHTGGSTDPVASPPTTEASAKDAVKVMKGYYKRGNRGSWHTEAASKAHELHHYDEWKCSSDHYWPTARTAIQTLNVPVASHADEAAAVTAMKAGAKGADAIMASFKKAARDYWFLLSDAASSRPYAAGQLALNPAIQSVQTLAASKSWTVEAGVDTPSAANPCYEAYPAYTP